MGHEVADTVAVADLVVVPGGVRSRREREEKNKISFLPRGNHTSDWMMHIPCDQFDKVVIEGDAGTSIKDGGAAVTVEVCGDHLQGVEERVERVFGISDQTGRS